MRSSTSDHSRSSPAISSALDGADTNDNRPFVRPPPSFKAAAASAIAMKKMTSKRRSQVRAPAMHAQLLIT
jgi:hypothetical protein